MLHEYTACWTGLLEGVACGLLRRLRRPAPHPLTQVALDPAGAYLLDSGRIFVLWLGRAIPPAFVSQARIDDVLQFAPFPSSLPLGRHADTSAKAACAQHDAPLVWIGRRGSSCSEALA